MRDITSKQKYHRRKNLNCNSTNIQLCWINSSRCLDRVIQLSFIIMDSTSNLVRFHCCACQYKLLNHTKIIYLHSKLSICTICCQHRGVIRAELNTLCTLCNIHFNELLLYNMQWSIRLLNESNLFHLSSDIRSLFGVHDFEFDTISFQYRRRKSDLFYLPFRWWIEWVKSIQYCLMWTFSFICFALEN